MSSTKEMDLLRRRNAALTKELEETKDKYDQLKHLNSKSVQRAKELFTELEEIKTDWLATMDDLHAKQEECHELVAALREVKLIMEEPMPTKKKTSRFKKIMDKLRKE